MIEPGNYQKRLAIIVPYRDRSEHLQTFLQHMLTYFQRDKFDRYISVSIHIIEQAGTGLFNQGRLKNCGFILTESKVDYVCFHDVDYLPIWADYSYCTTPTRLIWHGLTLKEDHESFFGAVVMFSREHYWKVNGYNNDYWGWGYEDVDLYTRCQFHGFKITHRDGTYQSLPHQHLGRRAIDGRLTEVGRANRQRLEANLQNFAYTVANNGVRTLGFTILKQQQVVLNKKLLKNVFYYLVNIENQETPSLASKQI